MQINVFNKINVSTRIIILILIIFSLILANSLYYIIFLSILFVILFILTNKSVKCYIEVIKNVKFWLLFSLIAYIIVMGNVLHSIVFIYKIVLILLYIKQFGLTVKFTDLCNGVKTLLVPLEKKLKTDTISYNLVLSIYFINFYIDSRDLILKKYSLNKRIIYMISLKYNVLPRVFLAIKKTKELESIVKLNYYSPKLESKSIKSNVILIVCSIIFIVVIFKEVIL